MKNKLTACFLSVFMLLSLLPARAMATNSAEGIAVDAAHFPDANFRSYVAEECDTDRDGFLSDKPGSEQMYRIV